MCSREDKLPTLPKCDLDEGYPPEAVLAMNSANASLATTEQLLSGVLHALEIEDKTFPDERKMILTNDDGTPLTSVTWNPTSQSYKLSATFGINVMLLGSNVRKTGSKFTNVSPNNSVVLAVLGKRGGSRYVAFAGNPLNDQKKWWDLNKNKYYTTNNEQMDTLLKNTIRWLAGTKGKDPITLRFTQLKDKNHEKYSRAWLDKNMPEVKYNDIGGCQKIDDLDECIKVADILVVGSPNYNVDHTKEMEAMVPSVKRAMDAGVGILYVQGTPHQTVTGEKGGNSISLNLFRPHFGSLFKIAYWNLSQ